MTFTNQKEETLNLELTSYGKHLLSLGKFKPSQYAFFDDDIIYDRQFVASASTELQNNIEDRIQEETPRLRPQSLYRAAEIGVFSENASHVNNLMPGVVSAKNKEDSEFLLETPKDSYLFSNPIGNSAYNSNNIAAWDVGFYKAGLKSVQHAWTGSADPTDNGSTTIPTTFIPQLFCDIKYEAHFFPPDKNHMHDDEIPDYIWAKTGGSIYSGEIERIDGLDLVYKLSDSSFMTIHEDFAFLKVEEANSNFEKENFELEVYMVKSEATDKNPEVLERLYFADDSEITDKNVEYYFDILYDFDIDEGEFCSLNNKKEKIKNIYSDKIFNCDKIHKQKPSSENIYGTSENQEIEDVCD
jgi:hypothetical protein